MITGRHARFQVTHRVRTWLGQIAEKSLGEQAWFAVGCVERNKRRRLSGKTRAGEDIGAGAHTYFARMGQARLFETFPNASTRLNVPIIGWTMVIK